MICKNEICVRTRFWICVENLTLFTRFKRFTVHLFGCIRKLMAMSMPTRA